MEEIVRDRAFGERLTRICDNHPLCPPEGKGRLSWIRDRMAEHGAATSIESVRKWLKGVNRPNRKSLLALSRTLGVDPAWLSLGSTETSEEDITPLAEAAGAQAVVSGFLKLAGLETFFPDDGSYDFEVIYRNKKRLVRVALAEFTDSGLKFSFPGRYEKLTLPGFVQTSSVSCTMFLFPPDIMPSHGVPNGPEITITIDKDGKVPGQKRPVATLVRDLKDDLYA